MPPNSGEGLGVSFETDLMRSALPYPTPLRCLFCYINLEYNPAF